MAAARITLLMVNAVSSTAMIWAIAHPVKESGTLSADEKAITLRYFTASAAGKSYLCVIPFTEISSNGRS